MTKAKKNSPNSSTKPVQNQPKNAPQNKPWKGRFSDNTDAFVEYFTESVSYDSRLYHYDIIGSIAHADMLNKIGILSQQELQDICSGLESIRADISAGIFAWQVPLEDVHMNIEAALVQRIGDAGKKLHTGRSRNDQVATDMRLFLRDELTNIQGLLRHVMEALLTLAADEAQTIMPGFTHMQAAQPVTFGHHMLAWFEMLYRDHLRLQDCYTRINVMPLGSAALAGTSYPIDRQYTAKLLDFPEISNNSLDAVSDRDFIIEFSNCGALIMMHLSRFSEELVLWMSQQFNFIDLGDAWCTGSSIMPQKKNPDIPELVRGKTARVYGHLMSLITLMKSQPLAYNRDNQEDKTALFDIIDTVKDCLYAYQKLVPEITPNRQRMREAATQGFTTATDLADYMVGKNIPFRDAHEVTGKIVQYAIKNNKVLSDLTLDELQNMHSMIEQDIFTCISLEGSINARCHHGGTAPEQVKQAILLGHKRLKKLSK